MVAVPVALHKPETQLEQPHYMHLLSEGFSPDEISELETYGIESISISQAKDRKIQKWNGHNHVSDGGLYFPFHDDYGQIRFNTPITVDGETFKYLGPQKPARAWFPNSQVYAITEGWKDAAMPTVRGIPTAAIVGVDNIIHCINKDCKLPIIFDSDGWTKPQVVRALVVGSMWTGGKINLFPQMPNYPTGGACEFFKNHSIADYQQLIDAAMKPADFIAVWVEKWQDFDDALKADCAKIATELSYALQHSSRYIQYLESKVTAKQQEWVNRI